MNNVDASLLLRTAEAAAGGQQYPAPALYVVATPIGNLADLSLRAIHVLALVDAVACEDTRVTGNLLKHLGLHKPLLALHEHNEQRATQAALGRLTAGERIAYASDAGTPAISDPGAGLVAATVAGGFRVVPVPGASSPVAAFSIAGDAQAQGFCFHGFLPGKSGERREALQRLAPGRLADVLFEAPHRIASLAQDLAQSQPDRRLTVCRELTKQFEAVATLPAADLPAWLAADPNRQRGEFVLVLHALATRAADAIPERVELALPVLLQALPLKQAVALASTLSGAPRNAVYERALVLKAAAEQR